MTPAHDENWTTDAPEMGKQYWMLAPPGEHFGYGRPVKRYFDSFEIRAWGSLRYIRYLRSIMPIPALEPPPLPQPPTTKEE
jgi:hypothetical protein